MKSIRQSNPRLQSHTQRDSITTDNKGETFFTSIILDLSLDKLNLVDVIISLSITTDLNFSLHFHHHPAFLVALSLLAELLLVTATTNRINAPKLLQKQLNLIQCAYNSVQQMTVFVCFRLFLLRSDFGCGTSAFRQATSRVVASL
jgi:hypothetical protein